MTVHLADRECEYREGDTSTAIKSNIDCLKCLQSLRHIEHDPRQGLYLDGHIISQDGESFDIEDITEILEQHGYYFTGYSKVEDG